MCQMFFILCIEHGPIWFGFHRSMITQFKSMRWRNCSERSPVTLIWSKMGWRKLRNFRRGKPRWSRSSVMWVIKHSNKCFILGAVDLIVRVLMQPITLTFLFCRLEKIWMLLIRITGKTSTTLSWNSSKKRYGQVKWSLSDQWYWRYWLIMRGGFENISAKQLTSSGDRGPSSSIHGQRREDVLPGGTLGEFCKFPCRVAWRRKLS